MNAGFSIMASVFSIALSATAGQRVSFVGQLRDGMTSTFSCDCYSTQQTGPGKMIWYPSVACWIDSPGVSKTCKVWSIMPLLRLEQNDARPVWHCSRKPLSHVMEPSMRYYIQYFAASAETNVTLGADVEHRFDIDTGDLFQTFGRDRRTQFSGLLTDLLEKRADGTDKSADGVLCSSGRIGIVGSSAILMYGMTVFRNGECMLKFSVNGLGDIRSYGLVVKNGKVYDRNNRLIEARPIINTAWPMLAIWMSDAETVSLRISHDYKALQDPSATNDDIHISLVNLLSIVDWLAQPPETRGAWQAKDKCSLESRRIF